MEARRRISLYEQMTSNRRDSLASLFLNDVVLAQTATASSTTLLDIIKNEDEVNNNNKNRNSWKAFKDKLRLKRTEPIRSSTIDIPLPIPIPISIPIPIPHNNNRTLLSEFSQEQNDVVEEDSNNQHMSADVAVAEPGNVLLMDLLEETDPETELIEGSGYKMNEDDEEKVEEEEESEGKCGVGNSNWCCVCMVRDKGAAFIPCGHTFCRMCCKEIWVSKGNCPLCNNFILEILHLF